MKRMRYEADRRKEWNMKSTRSPLRLITAATLACGLLAAAIPISATAADVPAEVTLFKNVNVFDGKSDKLLMGYDVLVVKNLRLECLWRPS